MCLNPLLISVSPKEGLEKNQFQSNDVWVQSNIVDVLVNWRNHGISSSLSSSRIGVKQFLGPCRRCQECLISRSVDIGVRCHYESLVTDKSCFVTLTYDAEHVGDYKLHYDDASKFLKRLRRYADYHYGIKKIRYAIVGEYGEKHGRPHWHVLLFGFDPTDKRPISTKCGLRFTSDTLLKLWGKGHVDVGTCSPNSCFYTARYCQKKWRAEHDYDSTSPYESFYRREVSSLLPPDAKKRLRKFIRDRERNKERREIFHCSRGLGLEQFMRDLPRLQRDFSIPIPMRTNRSKVIQLKRFPVPSAFRRYLKIAVSEDPQYISKYYNKIRERIFSVWKPNLLKKFLEKLQQVSERLFHNFNLDDLFRRRMQLKIRSRLGNVYRVLDNTS